MLTSIIGFTVLYGVLAVVETKLMFRTIRGGLAGTSPAPSPDQPDGAGRGLDKPLSFAY